MEIHRTAFLSQPLSGPEQSEPRVLNDSEIAESLWLMPSKDTTDVAVGNEEDVVEPSQLVPLIDPINLDIRREREFLGENSDDEDTVGFFFFFLQDQGSLLALIPENESGIA